MDGTPRVLLAGAGLTSSFIARMLQDAVLAGQLDLHVWEKSRVLGGRTSVACSDETGGKADMGAQYITEVEGVAGEHRALYDALERMGVIQPMSATIEGSRGTDDKGKKWVAPDGFSAIVKALLKESGAHVALGRAITEIERVNVPSKEGASKVKWRVIDASRAVGGGAPGTEEDELFDAVVLTMPAPTVLSLGGSVAHALLERPDLLEGMKEVEYSSRYCVALFYPTDDTEAAKFLAELPWACKYVPKEEEPAIVFFSKTATMHGTEGSEPPSLVVHSSVPYALAKMGEAADSEAVGAELVAKARALLPGLPAPADTRTTLWRYSQVRKPIAGAAAHALADSSSPLILAGDAFSDLGSCFDGCFESAHAATQMLREQLHLSSGSGGTPSSAPQSAP